VKNDKQLAKRIRAGDENAFNELVRTYQKPVYQVAYRILNSREDAEDVAQDVFIQAYRQIGNFRGDSSLFTWIYRIAVNAALNAQRKKKVRRFLSLESIGFTLSSRQPTHDQKMERDEIWKSITRAVDRLPEKQKIVFTLRYEHNLSHAEIARILDRDEGTIRANYHQAIRKLRKALQVQ
jgi:RNA polymerase sigma-70 factor (ECF subfamily)